MSDDWMDVLRAACAASSQAKVAARIGISTTVVNHVLNDKYKGRLDRVAERVRGELMRATVECPVLGELSRRVCLDHQQRPFSATNPTRVQLYFACRRGCVHSEVQA
jgi:hypothetical protein